jgi:putative transposase
MKILNPPFKETIEKTIYRVCAWKDWKALALQVMPDHIHFFVPAPPKWAPSEIVQSLKAWTSKDLRKKFSIIRQTRPETDDLWASSYYCGTAGHVSAEQVARYIRENSSRF